MAYGYVAPQTYREPTDKYSANPQGAYGSQSDFFRNQTYTNPYADFTKGALANSAAYNARQPQDPFGASGPLGNAANFGTAFGYSGYGDINSPWSKAQMTTHMGNLRGGEQNLVDQYTRAAANAGVTSGRGGFGVSGTASPESVAQQNAMRTLAGAYGGNYGQAMGYLKSQADVMDAQAAAMANLYGNIYNTNAQTGLGYSGQALQATAGDAAAQEAWNNRMFQAYQADVANRNRLVEAAPDKAWQEKTRQQQWNDQQAARDAQAQYDQMLRYLDMTRPGSQDVGMYGMGMKEYLKAKGAIPILPTSSAGKYSGSINRGLSTRMTNPYVIGAAGEW